MVGRELFIFLFVLGLVLFNWPFLMIFSPTLPYFMFIAWGVFILAIALIGYFNAPRNKGG